MFDGRYPAALADIREPQIAVFWSKFDTSANNAGNVSFRETNNAVLRQQALKDIQRAYPAVCIIDHLFIVTWYQVRPPLTNTDKVQRYSYRA